MSMTTAWARRAAAAPRASAARRAAPVRHRSAGIVGLPNVGKSTLFNALTSTQKAEAANYPFCTIEPNHANVTVPDPRLDKLAEAAKARRTVRSQLEFTDIAGLVAGAHRGEGLGNKFLANVRAVSVILHVVRCYEDPGVLHVSSRVDPADDVDVIETELVLADLQSVERRLGNARKKQRGSPGAAAAELVSVLERCYETLDAGTPIREAPWLVAGSPEELPAAERAELKGLQLLTAKPTVYVCNVGEEDAAGGNDLSREVERIAAERGQRCVTISAGLEEEVLREEDPLEYLQVVAGLEQTGLERVIRETAVVLGVHPYYTVGEQEARSWMIRRGTHAVDAAAKIHSDISEGFIRAEVVRPEDIFEFGSMEACRKAGRARLEGKEYVVEDGDVVEFRFKK